jgi:hypothetical protein
MIFSPFFSCVLTKFYAKIHIFSKKGNKKMIKKFLSGVFLMFMGALPAHADLYYASGIAVQADADNPVQAKQMALEQGQRTAFAKVVRKLLGQDKDFFVADLPIQDIVNQVRDISIQNEKNTAQSYWAEINVHFNEKNVQDFLTNHNQEYLKTEPPTYLVIPVMMAGNRFYGLEDDNVFYQHLRQTDVLSDFYQMVLPVGDVDEMVAVHQALGNSQYQGLMDLANRYGANRVLLVWASPKTENNWRLTTKVVPDEKITHQNVDVDDWYGTLSLDEAWQQMLDKMEDNWRQADSAEVKDNTYYARLDEPSLHMWAKDEKKFRQLEFLQDLTVRGAYQNQILMSFSFVGSNQELTENWDKAGWTWQSDLTGPGGTLTRKEVYYE